MLRKAHVHKFRNVFIVFTLLFKVNGAVGVKQTIKKFFSYPSEVFLFINNLEKWNEATILTVYTVKIVCVWTVMIYQTSLILKSLKFLYLSKTHQFPRHLYCTKADE